ncbi:inner-membrane translocator [Candidatus Vecturithrix granuli]|uniref:Inner-membrane translocator n=1 Tax=Vecturithrix granuli TaxID=1499967 RepID=A0A081C4P7_VECG1|nr:inner-membrane translocator [Candidatus Vecturithrix granuli]
MTFFVNLLAAGIGLAAPLLIAALGELYAERSGVLNIGIEGMMLAGAWGGFVGTHFSKNLGIGLLTAILIGLILALLNGLLTISFKVNQVVSGIAINILTAGLTMYLYRVIFGIPLLPITIKPFQKISIPLLSKLPYLGDIFFNHNLMVYLAFLLVPVAYYVLYKTSFGLEIRSVGEKPEVVDSAGLNVFRMRYIGMLIGGVMAGLAGAFYSLAYLNMFSNNIISGRGFIAFSAVIFGGWHPFRIMMATLIFGIADALSTRVLTAGIKLIPYELLLALPYIVTIIATLLLSRRSVAPASLGVPYQKE